MRLTRQGPMRSGRARLLLQRLLDRARPCRRGLLRPSGGAFLRIALRLFPRAPRGGAFFRWRKFHSRSPPLGKADRDRLPGRPRSMFSFANVFHFFAHKFPGLSGRRFPFPLIFAGPVDHIFCWHNSIAFAARPTAGCRKSYPRPETHLPALPRVILSAVASTRDPKVIERIARAGPNSLRPTKFARH